MSETTRASAEYGVLTIGGMEWGIGAYCNEIADCINRALDAEFAAIERETLERAAACCDKLVAEYEATSTAGRILGANACAEAIRALMETQ